MSLTLTGRDLVTRAFQTLGIYQGGAEPPSADDLQIGFRLLHELIDSWAIQALTVLSVQRQVYNLVANQGGPDNPYFYGPSGDWDTGSAARPPSIQDANLLLATSGNTPIRIPLPIITTDMTAATVSPTLPNQLPVTLYYNDTVPLGTAILWPIPSTTVNQIELFVPIVTADFVDLSTEYVCPPGYLKAFRLGLAESLIPFFGVPADIAARIPLQAADALNIVKTSNVEMGDLSVDPAWTSTGERPSYVIQTDQNA